MPVIDSQPDGVPVCDHDQRQRRAPLQPTCAARAATRRRTRRDHGRRHLLAPGVPSHWSVYIGVEDSDATAAKAAELGGIVVQGPEDTPYGRLATINDPWGAMIKLFQLNS
ncbi:VOC family protein [Williamsia sp.]|uniref:VOC family protein n=1 Tax=Williamsia sp. TaxID=1872085 RepID=UPI0039C94C78